MKFAETPVILLAAGKSSRMGSPKGLLEKDRITWLERQLRDLSARGLSNCVVVLGYDVDLYFRALPWLETAQRLPQNMIRGISIRTVLNTAPERGQFSSIQTGALFVSTNYPAAQAAWILPIDCTCPGPEVWEKLRDAVGEVVLPVFEQKGGHPVRVSLAQLRKLMRLDPLDPESRLDLQNRKLGSQISRIEVKDPTVHANFNTPTEWKA